MNDHDTGKENVERRRRDEALAADWVSDALDSRSEEQWRQAVASDPALLAEAQELREVAARLRELPHTIAPERDLWAGIAARIDREEAASRRPWLWAAALAASIAGAFVLGRWSGQDVMVPAPPPTASAVASSASAGDGGPVLAAYAPAGASLTATAETLRQAFAARRSELPSATVALVERNLETIDQAIAEIEVALARSPGDHELGRTLIGYQLRQIAVLSQVQRTTARL